MALANGAMIDSNGDVISSSGDVVGSLHGISEQADGTKTAIMDLNGKPVRVKVEKDGTVRALDDITEQVNNMPSSKTISVSVKTTGFSTLRDLMSTVSSIGSRKYNGIDYVPYDGYNAILHKGERVMTAQENKAYSAAGDEVKIQYPSTLTAVLQIDGREFTRATLPLINEGLGKQGLYERRR